MSDYKRIGHLKDYASFMEYLKQLGLELPVDEKIQSAADGSPMAQTMQVGNFTVGNRWCIHPMEGWDANPDGTPSQYTTQRWHKFAISGAKLLWGGEAFAVQADGRANPSQLYYRPENLDAMRELYDATVKAHKDRFGTADDMLLGLQLTHSGRFSRPNDKKKLESKCAYHHPTLDARCGVDPNSDEQIITDDYIKTLIDNYIISAKLAHKAGYKFVDVKHCHGYLGHEILSGYDRPGKYGGDLKGRTQFMREIIEGIKAECPGMIIGVRISIFDQASHKPDPAKGKGDKLGPGIPDDYSDGVAYPGFGCNRDNPQEMDLTEPIEVLKMMRDEMGVEMVNISAGSPYYNPHIQRPAFFPPSDGYQPPEDPLVGVVRQIQVVGQIKKAVPNLPMVGSAYSYLQEWLPNVAQAVVREGLVDSVGIGRLVLSYPDLLADTLETGEIKQPKLICRTFSDCTTAPRNGIISGCYPLDDIYKNAPEHEQLKDAKKALREKLKVINQG